MVQLLCELALVSGGPELSILDGVEPIQGGVRAFPVVVGPPVLRDDLGFEERIEADAVAELATEAG